MCALMLSLQNRFQTSSITTQNGIRVLHEVHVCYSVKAAKVHRRKKKKKKKRQPHPVHYFIYDEGKRGVFSCVSWNKWNNNTFTALQVASWWVKALISFPFSPLVGSLGNDRTNKCRLCFRGLKPKLSQLGGRRAPWRALVQSTVKT